MSLIGSDGSYARRCDKCVACNLDQQCRDFENLATRGDGGDKGGDAKTNFAEPGRFVHNGVDLLRAHPLRIKNRFCIIENYDHLL